jgi:dipeptidase E
MKKLIAASTSTLYQGEFLEYLKPELRDHFDSIKTLLFIPYARPGGISHQSYTDFVVKGMKSLPFSVRGIHEFGNPKRAIEGAEAIFVGGGNTFVLLDQLYQKELMDPLRSAVNSGVPYLGTSAGSNIVGQSIKTTNDMPIVHPDSLQALGLIPFNVNPHYLDSDPKSIHQGESRETRIREFHTYNNTTVIGLREGSWIKVSGHKMTLKGTLTARIFKKNESPFELAAESDLSELL